MKKMKIAFAFVAVSLAVLLSTSLVSAQLDTLDISIAVRNPSLCKGQSQGIALTTNKAGKGIVFVLQPALGDPWAGFLMAHPILAAIWASVPTEIKTQVQEKIGDKIVSYKLIVMDAGGSIDVTFPDDFTGINGEPSTALMGTYEVCFIFLSKCETDEVNGGSTYDAAIECTPPRECRFVELDFACGGWFVIPEVPLGTIAPILSALAALPVAKLYKRKHA